jgi:SOS response regulatory protein OraA/RecX
MKLSDKQIEAIFKMEEYAGISSHREIFKDYEEFRSYWELLDKKCKKKKGFFKAIETGKVSLVEIRKKKQQEILSYYQDLNHLTAYGEKYIQKYAPSSGKLLQQLTSKCKDKVLGQKVFDKLLPALNDQEQISGIINKLMRHGKSLFQIRIALSKKLFPKILIEKALSRLLANQDKNIEDSNLSSQISKMRKKGKSIREINQKLRGSVYDKVEVSELISSATAETSDIEILEIAIEKLLWKKVEPKKIIQRLSQKGFSYVDIKKVLTKGK